jgi:hypothetical protein
MPRQRFLKSVAAFKLGIAAALIAGVTAVSAQQAEPTNFDQTYKRALAKAREECKTLWSNHAFDTLRDKLPFPLDLDHDKPTWTMLTNKERIRQKDKRIADLTIRTLEQCRASYAPAYAMLPPQIKAMIREGLERKQDALIAELFAGKITFGKYNVAISQMIGEFVSLVSGMQQSAPSSPSPAVSVTNTASIAGPVSSSPPRQSAQNVKPNIIAPPQDKRLVALVIGNSNYLNLSKLSNPSNDALSIAEVLGKMGFRTKTVFDASEQDIRREVRKFASETDKADIALVFYAGHGAQVNGENYLLPVDVEIARTEADIQFTGLKVDDLVNSIRANTKVVFLDACRDNPVLFKNLVKGRGHQR